MRTLAPVRPPELSRARDMSSEHLAHTGYQARRTTKLLACISAHRAAGSDPGAQPGSEGNRTLWRLVGSAPATKPAPSASRTVGYRCACELGRDCSRLRGDPRSHLWRRGAADV